MDIAELNAFSTVAELGSFSRAAEQLHLSQPAVSKRIASLEDSLDTRLFDRIGRKTQLTEAGKELLPRARRILLEVQDSKRALGNLTEHVSGRLSIGTSHHIGLHRLPPALRSFNSDFPDVELDLHFMDSEQACSAVEHGDLELGIVTLPLEPLADLHTELLWRDRLEFVTAHDHPLANKKNVNAVTLGKYPCVLPSRETYTRTVLENAFSPYGVSLSERLSTNYLETIKMMVSIGLGWSVLPHTMVDEHICVLNVKGIKLERQLGVVEHTERTLSNAAHAFVKTLQKLSDKN